MAFQFLHVSTYAREKPKKASKGKDKKWTVRDIAGEVERDPDHSKHVANPLEPKVVFGMGASQAVAEAEQRAEQSKDVSGRKVRKDTPVLLAGVASHPYTVDQLKDPAAQKDYDQWKRDTVTYLKKKYGDNLLSVVEHLDEKHPHVHFYVVPKAGPGFNAKSLHDGFKAAEGVKDPKQQKERYCEGMRAMQDDYFKEVGAKYGHARLGPQRRRLTRAEWVAEQHQLQQLSKLMRSAKATIGKARKEAALIIAKARTEAESVSSKAKSAGARVGSFFGGVAAKVGESLKSVSRSRDEALAKAEAERQARTKAEAEAKKVREELLHERLKSDEVLKNLVTMKTQPLEKKLKTAEEKAADLNEQLESLSKDKQDLLFKLAQYEQPDTK